MAINSYPADKKGISNSQWTYTAVGGETTLSGYDSKGQPLSYLVNQEQFFLNGVMLVRNVDYTATTGTTITGLTALSASDFVEILTYSNFNVSTLPATQITGTVQNNQLQNNSIVLGSTTLSLGGTSTSISGLTIDGTNNTIRTNRGATNPTTNQVAGDLFWNTTSNSLQLWNGTTWISFAAPNAPTIGTATDVGTSRAYNNAAAAVSFTPSNTGGNATQYFVTSTPGSLTSYGTSSPITITGLSSSTQYTFTISAVGSFGNSPASNPTGNLTVTSVPQAPTIGTATGGNQQASVAFTPGATGGATATYTATSTPGSFTATGSSSPLIVTGLTNGTSYTFSVTANNTNGSSIASGSSNQITANPVVGASWITQNTGGNLPRLIVSGGGSVITPSYDDTNWEYSTNLTTWNTVARPHQTLSACWDGTKFATISYSGSTWAQSTNGSTWTSGSTTGNVPSTNSAIAYGNSVYVCSGRTAGTSYSSDGKAWTQAASNPSMSDPRLAFGNGIFLMVTSANSTIYYTSTNGSNWTSRTAPAGVGIVSFANGYFFINDAIGASTTCYTSTDGINWTSRTLPTSTVWAGFTYVNGVYVGVGTGGSAYSTDLTTWTAKTFSISASSGWPPITFGSYAVAVDQNATASIRYLSVT